MPLANLGLKTKIFRIVHLDNLDLILRNGLVCPNSPDASCGYKNIGNTKLISDRGEKQVNISPHGSLNNYVPFYFAPRSPMLYSIIHKGGSYSGPQENIIHLVSDIDHIHSCKRQYVFTDRHAKTSFAQFYSGINDLNKLDWKIMNEKYWNDTQTDNDRKYRRMAEFLVYDFVPVNCIFQIGVMTKDIQQKVIAFAKLHQLQLQIQVLLKPEWYY